MKLALVGATGFVGTAVARQAERQHIELVAVSAPRLAVASTKGIAKAAHGWIDSHRTQYQALVRQLSAADVVVNAAGLAMPESGEVEALNGANAALPGVLAEAAAEAGTARIVHVSSAAVQGRRDPLDESPGVEPVTPYARSKALGEAVLLRQQVRTPPEVTVYRPTSVQGADRAMTRQLVRLASMPAVPVCAGGDVPLPVCLVDNVAAGIVHACATEDCHPIVLHPSEGMTTRSLFEAFGAARLVSVPRPLMRTALRLLYLAGTASPKLSAIGRRVELLSFGQGQNARALLAAGFTVPAEADAYARLAAEIRGQQHP